jgi:hypothetical protein
MISKINQLINTNLNIICKTENHEMFASDFLDNEGERIFSDFKSKQFADEMVSRGLIRRNNELCIVEELGFEIYKDGGWNKYKTEKKLLEVDQNKQQKRKEELEIRKSNIDLELAERTLKEFPKTKWFARIGFIIGIVLILKELYILIWK